MSTTLGLKAVVNSSISLLINGSGLLCVPGFIVGEGVGVGKGVRTGINGLVIKLFGRGVVVGIGVGVGVGELDPPPLETVGMAGIDVTELDAALSPFVLTALRVIEYEVPFVSPVMTTGEDVTAGEKGVYVDPSSEYL